MWRRLVCMAGMLLAGSTWAGANDVIVDKVWMRESVPDQTSSTVQLNLTVTKPARLLAVSSPVAESGEIQGVVMRKGRMQSATVDSMQLRAHSTTLFGERGTYLTLVGLKRPLLAGESIPITLVLDVAGKRQTVNIEAMVKELELSYQHYLNPQVKDHR